MEHNLRQSDHPAALPYPIEDQSKGWDAIQSGSFVILSIDYELSMKNLCDPDVDHVTSSMPNKKYLALVTHKTVDSYGHIIAYKIDILLLGRKAPANARRGLTGGECVPISPNNQHLELRSPVTPEGPVPFPYPGYYIHTTTALRCRVAQVHISGPEVPIFTLPKTVITRLGIVKTADLARMHDRLALLKIHGQVPDDPSPINWEEELQTIRAHIARWPSDAKEKFTRGDEVYLDLFSDPTYAPQKPGGSRHVFICLNVWTDITQDLTLTNPEDFQGDIDQMNELKDQSNREWLDHFKTIFFWRPDPEEHSDRVDHWVQEVDEAATKPPIDSHLLYQEASTQTGSTTVYTDSGVQTDPIPAAYTDSGVQTDPILAAYTDSGVQTDPILPGDFITKEALHVEKPSRLLGAEGNQKGRKKYASRARAFNRPVRKSPGPIATRLPTREAGRISGMKTRAQLRPDRVAHNANSAHRPKPSGRVSKKRS